MFETTSRVSETETRKYQVLRWGCSSESLTRVNLGVQTLKLCEPGTIAHINSPSLWGIETGEPAVQGQPELYSKSHLR